MQSFPASSRQPRVHCLAAPKGPPRYPSTRFSHTHPRPGRMAQYPRICTYGNDLRHLRSIASSPPNAACRVLIQPLQCAIDASVARNHKVEVQSKKAESKIWHNKSQISPCDLSVTRPKAFSGQVTNKACPNTFSIPPKGLEFPRRSSSIGWSSIMVRQARGCHGLASVTPCSCPLPVVASWLLHRLRALLRLSGAAHPPVCSLSSLIAASPSSSLSLPVLADLTGATSDFRARPLDV